MGATARRVVNGAGAAHERLAEVCEAWQAGDAVRTRQLEALFHRDVLESVARGELALVGSAGEVADIALRTRVMVFEGQSEGERDGLAGTDCPEPADGRDELASIPHHATVMAYVNARVRVLAHLAQVTGTDADEWVREYERLTAERRKAAVTLAEEVCQ